MRIDVTRPQWVNLRKPGQFSHDLSDNIFTCIIMRKRFFFILITIIKIFMHLLCIYKVHDRSKLHQLAALQWRHNERDGVSNNRLFDCLLNRSSVAESKKTSKLRVTGLCEGKSSVTNEFPGRRATNAQNVPIWWRHHAWCRTVGNSETKRRGGSNIKMPHNQYKDSHLNTTRCYGRLLIIMDFWLCQR